jgi:predicted RNase H-like HicB family nuclease
MRRASAVVLGIPLRSLHRATRLGTVSPEPQYTVNMTFRVLLEHDPETGDFSAVCLELPGCASAGETEAEARANIREAIALYLAPGDIELPERAKLVEVTVG